MAILMIPISKAGNYQLPVDTEDADLPVEMYIRALEEGFKVLLNARMSKVTGVTTLKGDELAKAHAKAKEIADENYSRLMAGTLTKGRQKASANGEPREVMTEALRLAKEIVKNQIRKNGGRISKVPMSKQTEVAREILATEDKNDPKSCVAKARVNLAERSNELVPEKVDYASRLVESTELIERGNRAAQAKKAKAKATANAKAPPKPLGRAPMTPAEFASRHNHPLDKDQSRTLNARNAH
ncbi:MAG: hypothetical protein ACREBQ_01185 [Nitrososphaerales archaeon]